MAIKPNLDSLHMSVCTAKYPKAASLARCQKLNLIYFYLKKHWCRVGSLPGSSNLSFLLQIHSQPLLWTRPNHLSLAFPAFIFITSNVRRSYHVLIPKVFPSRSLFHWTTTWTRLSPPFCTFHSILADSLLSHIQIQTPQTLRFLFIASGQLKKKKHWSPSRFETFRSHLTYATNRFNLLCLLHVLTRMNQ